MARSRRPAAGRCALATGARRQERIWHHHGLCQPREPLLVRLVGRGGNGGATPKPPPRSRRGRSTTTALPRRAATGTAAGAGGWPRRETAAAAAAACLRFPWRCTRCVSCSSRRFGDQLAQGQPLRRRNNRDRRLGRLACTRDGSGTGLLCYLQWAYISRAGRYDQRCQFAPLGAAAVTGHAVHRSTYAAAVPIWFRCLLCRCRRV